MLAPSVIILLIWMIVPLVLTVWYSFQTYNLLNPVNSGFAGLSNYTYFLSDPAFIQAFGNTLILTLSVLAITVVGGILLALLLDQPMFGQGIVRILVISPFFIMSTVAALVWKNMMMDPNYGIFAWIATRFGFAPVAWLQNYPLFSIIIIVAWQWLPFATLILLTALQSLDEEQKEAAGMDGANFIRLFFYIVLPHLARAITVVILIETIFLPVGVRRDPGDDQRRSGLRLHQHRLSRLLTRRSSHYDVGGASAGGGSWRSSSPTSSRSSLSASSARTSTRREKPPWPAPFHPPQDGRSRSSPGLVGVPHLLPDPVDLPDRRSRAEGDAILFPAGVPSAALDAREFRRGAVALRLLQALLQFGGDRRRLDDPGADHRGARRLVDGLLALERTKDILMWMLSTKMMPAVGVLVPIYLIFKNLNLLDNLFGLTVILMLINLPIVVWMLYTYFKEIPVDILEASRMDGAVLWKEIIYVLLPMAVPGIASTMLLNVILAWNEAFWTLNLTAAKAAPLTALIASYSSPGGSSGRSFRRPRRSPSPRSSYSDGSARSSSCAA